MSFTGLQAQAGAIVDSGNLLKAMPYLKEIIKRVQSSGETGVELDFPTFLIGTGYIQSYTSTGQKEDLEQALSWYERLEKEYPDSKHVKTAKFKAIDIHRAMGNVVKAIEEIKSLLNSRQARLFSYTDRHKLLKDITESYYSIGNMEEGLPYFLQLRDYANDLESKALGAAAAFEALVAQERYDDALQLLPELATDTEARYNPALNVCLLQTSDKLVQEDRLKEVTLLLSLTKTTNQMIAYYERRLVYLRDLLRKRTQMGSSLDDAELNQKIKSAEARIGHLRKLPSLEGDLTVRRARNYVTTSRIYEAFWMFYDLLVNNTDEAQAEFLNYAVFSNALELNKDDVAQRIGEAYREQYPEGTYYQDITAALAINYRETERDAEFKELVEKYLDERPKDPNSRILFAQWALFQLERERFNDIIMSCNRWQAMHTDSEFQDGLSYWKGLAYLNTSDFPKAIEEFDALLSLFPYSGYTEDALLRKGFAQFYDQRLADARNSMKRFLEQYPSSSALDQAYFVLGEVEGVEGNIELAMGYYRKAIELTESEDILSTAIFRIGGIFELMGDFDKMAETFEDFIDKYSESKKLTGAIEQLGRAYEHQTRLVDMLVLYRDAISEYFTVVDDPGIDAIIENYSEKYDQHYTTLTSTVAMLDRLDTDAEFREKMLNDRGFLFEYFYRHPEVDQALYNRMRFHPSFGPQLMDDLSPLDDITGTYRLQLSDFPAQTPVVFFDRLRQSAVSESNRVAETRALMGLYRDGITKTPSTPFDSELVNQLGPRLLLFVADYMRDKDLNFSDAAWRKVIADYPQSNSTVVAYTRLAEVSRLQGNLMEAFEHLDEIVKRFPGSPLLPNVLLSQGEIMTDLDRGQNARDIYQYILRVQEWRGIVHARALYQIGLSFLAEGEPAKAHGFFERTFLGYSHFTEWSAKAYYQDARALVAMNETGDAIKTLQEALDSLSPETAGETYLSIEELLAELRANYTPPAPVSS